jgi:hypothetical protein
MVGLRRASGRYQSIAETLPKSSHLRPVALCWGAPPTHPCVNEGIGAVEIWVRFT